MKKLLTELWTAKVGISWRGVAEYLSDRGITHRRTGSAGASASSPFAGWALGGGADKSNLRIQSLPVGNGNPTAPVLHKSGRDGLLRVSDVDRLADNLRPVTASHFGVHYG